MIEVFDPRGEIEPIVVARPAYPADLRGLRVGAIENTKHNAGFLISGIIRHLAAEHGMVDTGVRRKDFSSVGATVEMLDETARDCDLVLLGTAD
ncbi:MAG TPA: hypothetical protein VFX16_20010 [Pseudonocardiaceae bacterium]|nr:hypothetical protein [Pseudonocardiaceae bacterium]